MIKITPLQARVKKEMGREATSFLRAFSVVSPVIIYYVVCSLVNILFVLWFSAFSAKQQESTLVLYLVQHSSETSAVVNGIATVIGCLFVLSSFKKEQVVFSFPEKRKKEWFFIGGIALAAAISLNYLLGLLEQITNQSNYQAIAETQFSLPVYLALIMYGMISPMAEEIVFRGIVYNRFRRQYGLWISIFLSSLMFGLYHGNVIQAIYGTVLGMIIAVLYERYGSFWVPVFIHSIANVGIYCLLQIEEIKNCILSMPFCVICIGIVVLSLIFSSFRKR